MRFYCYLKFHNAQQHYIAGVLTRGSALLLGGLWGMSQWKGVKRYFLKDKFLFQCEHFRDTCCHKYSLCCEPIIEELCNIENEIPFYIPCRCWHPRDFLQGNHHILLAYGSPNSLLKVYVIKFSCCVLTGHRQDKTPMLWQHWGKQIAMQGLLHKAKQHWFLLGIGVVILAAKLAPSVGKTGGISLIEYSWAFFLGLVPQIAGLSALCLYYNVSHSRKVNKN